MTTLKSTKLTLDQKKGMMTSKETNKYVKSSGDGITEEYNSDCPLDSPNLSEWVTNVVQSWADGSSIRDDARLEEDEE